MEKREQNAIWIHFPAQAVVLVHVVVWGRETDTFLTELFLLPLLTLQQKLQIALKGVVHLISSSHVNTTLILKIKKMAKSPVSCFLHFAC